MKIKLLVVDDEEGICDFVKSFFEDQGLEVFYALTGKEGLEIFEKEKPQIIILDILMKGVTGMQALERIKQMDKNNYVFMLTRVIDEPELVDESMALGATGYLKKPVMLADLEKAIMPIVEKIKQTSAGKERSFDS